MAALPATPSSVGSSQQTLSEYAGPYVTEMLGKAQAVAAQPYAVYGGPQTAGESGLQSKVFQGLGNLSFPGQLGQSFSSPMGGFNQQPPAFNPATMQSNLSGAPAFTGTPPNLTQQQTNDALNASNTGQINVPQGIAGLQTPQASQQPSNIAQSYMNPYLQSVLQPQLEELRRQSQMNLQPDMARLTQAGGYGGGRQAIMQSEADRNLLAEQNRAIGTGYSNAYDKGLSQFNTEQAQAKGLADFMSDQGGQQRGIEQQGISADYNEFLAQRDYPQKMLQFQQSMLQGLPISTVSNQPAQMSTLGNIASTTGGLAKIYQDLKQFGL